jgi:small subunit ribosomal protein S7
MSRRRQATRRPVQKDAKFNSTLVSRLVNTVMISGKKSTAQRIVYGAFNALAEKNPDWKLRPVAWVAPPTRCRWK